MILTHKWVCSFHVLSVIFNVFFFPLTAGENDAPNVFPPYISQSVVPYLPVPAFFTLVFQILFFLYMPDSTLSSLRPAFTLSTSAPVDCQRLFLARPRIAQQMLCIIPESSLGKSPQHLIWTQSRCQRSPRPFVSSFGLYVCVHKNMLAPHVYQDKCNVKPRL